jgi:hypothetical protein
MNLSRCGCIVVSIRVTRCFDILLNELLDVCMYICDWNWIFSSFREIRHRGWDEILNSIQYGIKVELNMTM